MPGFSSLGDPALQALVTFLRSGKDDEVEIARSAARATALKYDSDGYNQFLDADGYPAITPPWGTLNAINLDTGDYVWKIPFGEYPELAAQGIKDTGTMSHGGGVVTAGGLLFFATGREC